MGGETTVASADDVPAFTQILYWPLRLAPGPGAGCFATMPRREGPNAPVDRAALRKVMTAPGQPWTLVDPYRRRADPREKAATERNWRAAKERYAEFVYFHPFVRRVLYPTGSGSVWVLDVLRHTWISSLHLCLRPGKDGQPADWVRLRVPHAHLYLFPAEIAVLVLEVCWDESDPCPDEDVPARRYLDHLRLGDIQNIIQGLRRVYPPYWFGEASLQPGGTLAAVEFHGTSPKGPWVTTSDFDDLEAMIGTVEGKPSSRRWSGGRVAPVARHWRDLLQPLEVYDPEISGGRPRFVANQLIDDRMPHLTYVAVENPAALERGAFVRLALGERSGRKSESLPYSQVFLRDFEDRHCYDRFWEERDASLMAGAPCRVDHPDPRTAAAHGWMTTRYLCNGIGMVVLGSIHSPDFREDIRVHVRTMYAQLGLLAHLQRAALIAFSDDLSRCVLDHKGQSDGSLGQPGFGKEIRRIYRRVLHFLHCFWYAEVTGQIQGQELFTLWRDHLGVETLKQQFLEELSAVKGFVDTAEGARQTSLATLAMVILLPAAMLGMNMFDTDNLKDVDGVWTFVTMLGWLFFALAATALLALIAILRRLSLRRLLFWRDER